VNLSDKPDQAHLHASELERRFQISHLGMSSFDRFDVLLLDSGDATQRLIWRDARAGVICEVRVYPDEMKAAALAFAEWIESLTAAASRGSDRRAGPGERRVMPRRRRNEIAATVVRTVIAYLLASIVLTVLFFEVGGGHADVPFTMFPGYFVVAPVLPVLVTVLVIWHLREARGSELLSLVAFVVAFVAAWFGTGALRARSAPKAERQQPRDV
jgi:hypothetical protein